MCFVWNHNHTKSGVFIFVYFYESAEKRSQTMKYNRGHQKLDQVMPKYV